MPADGVDGVGRSLEAAVRVPRRALRLTGGVLDLAHLVHVHERVELLEVDSGEGAPHREPFALVTGRGRGDLDYRALALRARLGDTRQDQEILDGDGWHNALLAVDLGCHTRLPRAANSGNDT